MRYLLSCGLLLALWMSTAAPAHAARTQPAPARAATVGALEEIEFSVAAYNTTEAGTAVMVQITVTCTPAPSTPMTVDWDIVAGGTATGGADYTDANGSVQFLATEGSKTFEIEILPDSIDEPDETINLELSNPQGGAILGAQTTAVLTIQDDGDTPPDVSISVAMLDVDEDSGNPMLQVDLSGESGHIVTVQVGTTDGSAVDPDDYLAPTLPVSFAPGVTVGFITLSIIDDTRDENDETFTVTISSPNNASLGATTSCIVTITDDDPPPQVLFSATGINVDEGAGDETIAVFLSAASNLTVTVNFATSGGTALAGSDYTALTDTLTFAPGEISKDITFEILEDTVNEPDETFNIVLSSPTNGTLGTPATFIVTIRANSEGSPAKKGDGGNCSAATGGGVASLIALAPLLAVLRRRRSARRQPQD